MGLQVTSFGLEGDFAAFRDPSVTTNQIVYFIPSKISLVGMIGAVIGIRRSNSLNEDYGQDYLDLFEQTSVGIIVKESSSKVTYFTNRRSLKEAKTKPTKSELLESPRYMVFVQTSDEYAARLNRALETREFTYTPYLGHMYCPARIISEEAECGNTYDCKEIDARGRDITSVVLDESETYNTSFEISYDAGLPDNNSEIIVERHLHHFMNNGILDTRVLKHFIPINGARIEIEGFTEEPTLSKFVHIEGINTDICMY